MPGGYHDDLIFDVGMHRGEDTEFYLRKGFRVVGVEANPDLCARVADKHAAHVADGRLTILNVAIAEKAGPIRFFRNSRVSAWGTLSPEFEARNRHLGFPSEEIEVEGVLFGDILGTYGVPYFLKIDIEGLDIECLRPLVGAKDRPRHVSMESNKTAWSGLLEELRLLGAIGYRRYKVVSQLGVPEQVPPNPAREGRYVDHTFRAGSSGLFGEEGPGQWLDEGAVLRRYRRVFRNYRFFGDSGLIKLMPGRLMQYFPDRLARAVRNDWFDTHASL